MNWNPTGSRPRGLVARALAEQPDAAGLGGVSVRRVVMVGTPNSGTVLATWLQLSPHCGRMPSR